MRILVRGCGRTILHHGSHERDSEYERPRKDFAIAATSEGFLIRASTEGFVTMAPKEGFFIERKDSRLNMSVLSLLLPQKFRYYYGQQRKDSGMILHCSLHVRQCIIAPTKRFVMKDDSLWHLHKKCSVADMCRFSSAAATEGLLSVAPREHVCSL
jgi:hypothetical protein